MKRFILALALLLALTGCAPKTAPVVVAPAETTAQAAYNAAATHVTYRWQTYAWSGHKWSTKANLLQHNEWGQSLNHPGKTLVVDTTGDIPASWFAAHRNVTGVIFYVPGAGGSGKWPSSAGVRSLRAHNVQIGWVWEAGATSMEGGYAAGVRAARQCLAIPKAYQVPATAKFYFANDSESSPSGPTAFLDGAASVLGKSRVGLYAGIGPINYNLKPGSNAYNIDVNEVRTADWGQEGGAKPAPKPGPVVRPAGYHARAVMRRTAQLWNDTIGTKRSPSPLRGGVVAVKGHIRTVRGLKYIEVGWASHDGWVRYDYIRWI